MKYLSILRKQYGWTQKQVCEKTGTDISYYQKIERGLRTPGKKFKKKMEILFGANWEFLNSDKKDDYENS